MFPAPAGMNRRKLSIPGPAAVFPAPAGMNQPGSSRIVPAGLRVTTSVQLADVSSDTKGMVVRGIRAVMPG